MENRTKPPETFRISATAKIWEPEDIAKEIITGIRRKKFQVAPGLEMLVLSKLHSVILPILNWYFDRLCQSTSED